jgi:hypothetical protein
MFLTVRYNYGGQWTALYFIGPTIPQIPAITNEHPYLWQGTHGYDGQTFHVMAHDPWIRYGPPENLEIAPFRYVRILVPLLAWLLAMGRDHWVDPAYYFLIVASGFLGAYWTSRWVMRAGFTAAWGLVFAATPAAITGVDLMLPDITLAALCAGFVVYAEQGPRWKICVVLLCAALTRETGAILFAAYGIYSLSRRRWADAAWAVAAAIPFLGWEAYVRAHSLSTTLPPPVIGWIPLQGFVNRILFVSPYPLPPVWRVVAVISDYVALAAIGAAIAMAVRLAWRREWTASAAVFYGFALAAIFLRGEGEWFDAHAFGRLLTPLLLLAGLLYLPRIGWMAFAPVVIVGGRVTVWLFHEMAGILHGLLR